MLKQFVVTSVLCLTTAAAVAGDIDLNQMYRVTGYKVTGAEPGSAYPQGLDKIGDFNGDGYDDFAVSSAHEDYPQAGATYVLYGSAAWLPSIDVQSLKSDNSRGFRISSSTVEEVGVQLAGAGDVNADGYGDLLLGTWAGSAYVIFGGQGPHTNLDVRTLDTDNSRGIHLWSSVIEHRFGGDVGAAGDLNGDGFDDFVVQGLGFLVFFGRPTAEMASFDVANFTSSDSNGFVVSPSTRYLGPIKPIGDFNGDNFDDVVIGRRLVYGKRQGFHDIRNEEPGENYSYIPEDSLGARTRGSGDYNGDGLGDICAGGGILLGRHDVAPNMLVPDIMFERGDYRSVELLGFTGDVNNDGYSDLLFKARVVAASLTSTIVLIYGNPTPPASMDLSQISPAQGFKILSPITGGGTQELEFASDLGDLNADGYDDYGIGYYSKFYIISGWQFVITAARDWELYD